MALQLFVVSVREYFAMVELQEMLHFFEKSKKNPKKKVAIFFQNIVFECLKLVCI